MFFSFYPSSLSFCKFKAIYIRLLDTVPHGTKSLFIFFSFVFDPCVAFQIVPLIISSNSLLFSSTISTMLLISFNVFFLFQMSFSSLEVWFESFETNLFNLFPHVFYFFYLLENVDYILIGALIFLMLILSICFISGSLYWLIFSWLWVLVFCFLAEVLLIFLLDTRCEFCIGAEFYYISLQNALRFI